MRYCRCSSGKKYSINFTARFADYELGFQMIVFDGDTKPSMTLSKYDFKNNRFLEHYKCDVETGNIE